MISNLNRVFPDVWKELPRDAQEVIIKAGIVVNMANITEISSKDSKTQQEREFLRQYANSKFNLFTTITNKEMVVEYLQQDLGLE